VGLVRHNEVCGGDTEHVAQAVEVLCHVLGVIATIGVDVEMSVSTLACAIGTHSAKGVDAVAKRVFQ